MLWLRCSGAALVAAGQLQLLESPRWMTVENGQLQWELDLPRMGVSLFQVSWPADSWIEATMRGDL